MTKTRPKKRKRRTRKETLALKQQVSDYLDERPHAKNPEISRALKIPLSAVSYFRIQLGRTAKRTSAQVEKLCREYQEFMRENPQASAKIAAEALGVKPSLIVYIRRKLDIAPKRSHRSRERLKARISQVLSETPDLSNRELANLVGKPKTTVVSIRKELDMGRDTQDSVLFVSIAQQVRDLVLVEGERLTDEQLAERVGISLRTLQRWLAKLGVPSGKERRYQPDERYFKLMWSEGWSDVDIAKVTGCGYQRIQKWRYRNNYPANVIHHSLRRNALCRSHIPTTLLDVLPDSPTGSKKYDRVWAFAALGADWRWLRKRFPDISRAELRKVIDNLLAYRIPRNFRKIIRRKQLEGYGTPEKK